MTWKGPQKTREELDRLALRAVAIRLGDPDVTIDAIALRTGASRTLVERALIKAGLHERKPRVKP